MSFLGWVKRDNSDDPSTDKAEPLGGAAPIRDGVGLSQAFPAKLEDWAQDKVGATLELLFSCTIQAAEQRIAWYNQKGKNMGQQSRLLRLLAIICGTLGTLFPLIDAASVGALPRGVASLGYVLLATAAALIAADGAFGVSSSWMRFRATQIEMERLLTNFRLDWTLDLARLNGRAPNIEEREVLLLLQRRFADAIETAAQTETNSWMQEFRGALAQLAHNYRPPLEPRSTHTTQVTNVSGPVGAMAVAGDAPALAELRNQEDQPERSVPNIRTIPTMDTAQDELRDAR